MDRSNGGITAVSRIPGSMEVWWIGANGSVQDAFWYDNAQWRRFDIAPAGSASPNGGITAVSRIPNSLEIWWVGANGSVQDAFWYEGQDGWRRFEIAPMGSASPNGGITAVSRIPNSLELWWVGANGSVQDAFWYADLPLIFTAPIVTGGLAALGGSVTVTINLDGSVRWQGHAHDSGADGYDFGITALIRPSSGPAIALAHTGSVGGTFTSGSRDHDWDETSPPRVDISSSFSAYNGAPFETHLEYDSDIGSAFESLVSWIIKFGVGTVFGAGVGVVVFVGVEIGSLISTGSLVPGARVLEGVLWMAGPGNTLLAIVAEGIASLGSRTREITPEEYDWANNGVFLNSLPPRDRLVLTDTIGAGNRAFTFPRYDGKITLNMGDAAFNDPRNYPGKKYGQTFIHELVHACQIQHTSIDITLLADAFASKVCEATGGNPYTYGAAGPAYSDFNLEQQAQIVSDWFGRYFTQTTPTENYGLSSASAINDPYFRYINENLRTGNL